MTPALYPAFFFVLEKTAKAQGTQSYQRFQCIGHMGFKGLSNAVTNTHPLLPSMGTTRQKSSCRNGLQTGPRLLSRVKAGTHSPSPTGSHTRAHTAKQVAFWVGVVSLPSERFTRFGNPAWPGGRTANFAAFGSWPGVLPKNAESLRNSDALMRVAVPRRRGPAGLRDLFRFCRNCGLYALRSGPFRVCKARGGITTLSALYVLLKRRTAACQNGSFAVF